MTLREIVAGAVRDWWRSLDTPNPWPNEVDAAVRGPDAVPVCHRCATPCELAVWFCPSCGAAVGPYNNIMPYVSVFSLGEAFRSGVGPEAHFSAFRTVAYTALGLAQYGMLAPLYLLRLFLNRRRLSSSRHTETEAVR
jgi:hypothetical protein